MNTLEQAEMFVDHLRLVGLEASCRRWGKRKDWLCISLGGADFLWKPGGDYDGYEMRVDHLSQEDVGRIIDETHKRSEQREARQEDREGEEWKGA